MAKKGRRTNILFPVAYILRGSNVSEKIINEINSKNSFFIFFIEFLKKE
ncbi:MAG: hypothetical protein M1326_10655 [Cyanobacteria bacterium]|nr:hypothetical protein [Cyanobacteriota bacterium]